MLLETLKDIQKAHIFSERDWITPWGRESMGMTKTEMMRHVVRAQLPSIESQVEQLASKARSDPERSSHPGYIEELEGLELNLRKLREEYLVS